MPARKFDSLPQKCLQPARPSPAQPQMVGRPAVQLQLGRGKGDLSGARLVAGLGQASQPANQVDVGSLYPPVGWASY